MALLEKGVDHELVPVDVFSPDGIPGWYRELHPFGRIPAFEHDGFRLFETAAITPTRHPEARLGAGGQ